LAFLFSTFFDHTCRPLSTPTYDLLPAFFFAPRSFSWQTAAPSSAPLSLLELSGSGFALTGFSRVFFLLPCASPFHSRFSLQMRLNLPRPHPLIVLPRFPYLSPFFLPPNSSGSFFPKNHQRCKLTFLFFFRHTIFCIFPSCALPGVFLTVTLSTPNGNFFFPPPFLCCFSGVFFVFLCTLYCFSLLGWKPAV